MQSESMLLHWRVFIYSNSVFLVSWYCLQPLSLRIHTFSQQRLWCKHFNDHASLYDLLEATLSHYIPTRFKRPFPRYEFTQHTHTHTHTHTHLSPLLSISIYWLESQAVLVRATRSYSGYGYNNDYDTYGAPSQFGSGSGWGGLERKTLPRNTVRIALNRSDIICINLAFVLL